MAGRFDAVREAARNVVDALRDKPSEVSVIGFGTSASVLRSATPVADPDQRRILKRDIDRLEVGGSDGGATNWEAALDATVPLGLDVVVLVTDGEPTVLGNPAREPVDPQEPLLAAVAAADRVKADGARLVAVGIDLTADGQANLARITGPASGDDYFPSDTDGLLRLLYGIVASSCGVAVAALPRPERDPFPLVPVLLAALAVLAAVLVAGYVTHRVRRASAPPVPRRERPSRRRHVSPTIDHQDIRRKLAEPAPPRDAAVPGRDGGEPPRGRPGSVSLDFLSGPNAGPGLSTDDPPRPDYRPRSTSEDQQ